MSSFDTLGLAEPLVRAVADLGYTSPTPIQQQAIPAVLSGGDLLAGAQTGTGKTAGFVLPILHRLAAKPPAPGTRRPVRVLILTPTRELAAQVGESVRDYGKYMKASATTVFGGVSMANQVAALKRGVDIVVATPGRLLDHVGQRTIDLSRVEILVLDEADRMLDMGFLPDMKRVFAVIPKQRQTMLFSATFSDEIRALAQTLLNRPTTVQATPRNTTVEAVAQRAILVDRGRKADLLATLVHDQQWYQVLVFTRTKHGANRLADYLNKRDVPALAIHGNKSQSARTHALAEFKSGRLQVLVATDIAARGLDIEQLPHVVNYDLPHVPEDYVHRIGRTGRAGASGEAISLICADDKPLLADIEKLIKREIPREVVDAFEPDPKERAEPVQRGRGQRPQRPQRSGAARKAATPQTKRRRDQQAPRPTAEPRKPARGASEPASDRRKRDGERESLVRSNMPNSRTTQRRGR